MDPGMGLMVHSMVPSEAEVPKLPPKSTLQLPDGFLKKAHVRHALKYITEDKQREKALEFAMAWRQNFAAEEWKPVVAAIETARKEDHVRSIPYNDDSRREDDDLHVKDWIANPTELPRAMTAASAPVVPPAVLTQALIRCELMRQHTANVSLPLRGMLAPLTPRRLRWDVITPGPVTPLSPAPSANSFSSWLRPEPAPPGEAQVSTPVTADNTEPRSPVLPRNIETREVYNEIKKDVDALARRFCMVRFKANSSGYSDFIPGTMIKPNDTLQAAFAIMDSHRIKLKDFIARDLPERLQTRAMADAKLLNRYCINTESELKEQNEWMNHVTNMTSSHVSDTKEHVNYEPQSTAIAVSILDEQRAVFRHLCKQRESEDLALKTEPLKAAWAAKFLNDAEHSVQVENDDSSSDSGVDDGHDEGYNYGNFLRTIQNDTSPSASSDALAPMVDELSDSELASMCSRSSTHHNASSSRIRDFRYPQRSSSSSFKEHRWSDRLSGSTVSNNYVRNSSFFRRSDLHIVTEANDGPSSSELSPEDRGFRHRGPDLAELGDWAQELKEMEDVRADRLRSPTLHHRPHIRDGPSSTDATLHSPTRQIAVKSINTPISPTGTSQSRFSSSSESSTSTNIPRPVPHLPLPKQPRSAPLSIVSDTRPTILDHEYHQRKKSNPSAHARDTSAATMAASLRRSQHLRTSSTVQILAKSAPKPEEDDWMDELKRMENSERLRQAAERRKTAELLRGDTLIGDEDVLEGEKY